MSIRPPLVRAVHGLDSAVVQNHFVSIARTLEWLVASLAELQPFAIHPLVRSLVFSRREWRRLQAPWRMRPRDRDRFRGTGLALKRRMPSPAVHVHESPLPLADVERWAALGAGGVLLLLGTGRRPLVGLGMAAAATPLIYRGVTGRWPGVVAAHLSDDDSKSALAGDRGLHVRESVRLELPVAEVYRFWRRLDNLPSFMAHRERVTVDDATGRS